MPVSTWVFFWIKRGYWSEVYHCDLIVQTSVEPAREQRKALIFPIFPGTFTTLKLQSDGGRAVKTHENFVHMHVHVHMKRSKISSRSRWPKRGKSCFCASVTFGTVMNIKLYIAHENSWLKSFLCFTAGATLPVQSVQQFGFRSTGPESPVNLTVDLLKDKHICSCSSTHCVCGYCSPTTSSLWSLFF